MLSPLLCVFSCPAMSSNPVPWKPSPVNKSHGSHDLIASVVQLVLSFLQTHRLYPYKMLPHKMKRTMRKSNRLEGLNSSAVPQTSSHSSPKRSLLMTLLHDISGVFNLYVVVSVGVWVCGCVGVCGLGDGFSFCLLQSNLKPKFGCWPSTHQPTYRTVAVFICLPRPRQSLSPKATLSADLPEMHHRFPSVCPSFSLLLYMSVHWFAM